MDSISTPYAHLPEMQESHRSAELVVPTILEVTGPVRSVVDLGGGDGGWLRVFQHHGVENILLIDHPAATPHVVIDKSHFEPFNLNLGLPKPRRFDLAVCLEFAEHLPESQADSLVEWLTASSDLVIFSAAVPGQPGRGHVHLRDPDYWKLLFSKHGFDRHDVLRPKILHNRAIQWWYRQNMFVFATHSVQLHSTGDRNALQAEEFNLIHKSILTSPAPSPPRGLSTLLREFRPALASAIKNRIGGLSA